MSSPTCAASLLVVGFERGGGSLQRAPARAPHHNRGATSALHAWLCSTAMRCDIAGPCQGLTHPVVDTAHLHVALARVGVTGQVKAELEARQPRGKAVQRHPAWPGPLQPRARQAAAPLLLPPPTHALEARETHVALVDACTAAAAAATGSGGGVRCRCGQHNWCLHAQPGRAESQQRCRC